MGASFRSLTAGGMLTVQFIDAKILDAAIIEQMHRDLIGALETIQERQVLLEFSCVQFMSSAALGMLIRVHKKCRERNITLKLCSINPEILKVFRVTSLDRIFDIYPDPASARAAFGKS